MNWEMFFEREAKKKKISLKDAAQIFSDTLLELKKSTSMV
jgi:hypothetical protein